MEGWEETVREVPRVEEGGRERASRGKERKGAPRSGPGEGGRTQDFFAFDFLPLTHNILSSKPRVVAAAGGGGQTEVHPKPEGSAESRVSGSLSSMFRPLPQDQFELDCEHKALDCLHAKALELREEQNRRSGVRRGRPGASQSPSTSTEPFTKVLRA